MKISYLTAVFIVTSICLLNGQTLLPYLNDNGKFSLLDSIGNEILPPIYDEIKDIINYDQQYFRAKKNNNEVIVLRSGDEFESIGFIDILKVQYFEEDFLRTQYEVPHLFLINYANKSVYFNTKTKRKIEILKKNKSYSSFEEDYHERYRQDRFINAYNGYIRFYEDGKVNFFDLNLNKVFQIGLFDAINVSKSYFIVKNEYEMYGIANSKGVFLTGYDWEVVKWAKRKDEFIVAKSKKENLYSIFSFSDNSIKGQTFYDIKSGSNSYLIFSKNKSLNGIMDFNGNVVYETELGSISHIKNNKFLISNFGKNYFDLIDHKGIKLTDFKFISHKHSNSFYNGIEYHLFKTDTTTLLYDCNLNLIYTGNIKEFTTINSKPYFYTLKNEFFGLINLDGKTILETAYDNIELININNDIKIKNYLKGLCGIKNINGEDFIVNKYTIIENDNDLIACRNIGNSNLWDYYNYFGKKIKTEKRTNSDLIQNFYFDKNEGVLKAIFKGTGKQITIPDTVEIDRQKIKIFGNETNFVIGKKIDQNFLIFNKDNKKILPEGFILKKEEQVFDKIDDDIYILVWKNHNNLNKFIENSNKVKPMNNNNYYKSELIAMDAPPDPNMKSTKEEKIHGTGIVDSKGNWIIPYKPNVFYYPLSKNLFIERVMDEEGYFDDINRIIILGKNIKSWDISLPNLQHSNIKDPNYVFRVQNIEKKVKPLFAYFSIKGEKLSEFNYVAGPTDLRNFNLVGIQKGIDIQWQIVDKSCKLIKELPKLSEDPNPKDYNIVNNYFFVKLDDSWVKFDSIGNNLGIKTKDRPIKSFKNGWNIFYVENLKKFELRNFENKVVFSSDKEFDFNVSQKSELFFITHLDNNLDGFICDYQGIVLKKFKGSFISQSLLKAGFYAVNLKYMGKYFYISTSNI